MSEFNKSESGASLSNTFSPGEKVEIVKLAMDRTFNGPESGHAFRPTTRLLGLFHGIVAYVPTHNDDHSANYHITEVISFDLDSGDMSDSNDIFFAENDLSYIISPLNRKPNKDQLAFEMANAD